jgi:NADH:ubiquinone oxidoreductase subunit E
MDKKNLIKLNEILSRHLKSSDKLIPILQEIQDKFGYLPDDVMEEAAQYLRIPASEAYGVATFYSFLSINPAGRNVIRVCKSLPCYYKSSAMVVKSIEHELGIKPGEVTPDGKFSLEFTNCIGGCDNPPAMLVNGDMHNNLTSQKISLILKSYNR